MYTSVSHLSTFIILGLMCLDQTFTSSAVEVVKSKKLPDYAAKSKVHSKQALEPLRWLQEKSTSKPKVIPKPTKVQRREIPIKQTVLRASDKWENRETEETVQPNIVPGIQQPVYTVPKLPVVKPLVRPNETEAERAERIHKSFERLLTFVEIVGQVDNYFSSKWKNLVRTVSNFYDVEDEPYRVSAKRIYGTCPHAH
ncbi:hypothetical protein RUM43_011577 [Polyplax serrata]|uniref:Uncharacterized protein n=1 Tax=Polyplax serrata TaxID=468196 RepID=A0AAN8S7X9_POLSC